MSRKRVWLFGAVLGLSMLLLAAPARSVGILHDRRFYNWNYEYRSQLGASGFFGPYDVDFFKQHQT